MRNQSLLASILGFVITLGLPLLPDTRVLLHALPVDPQAAPGQARYPDLKNTPSRTTTSSTVKTANAQSTTTLFLNIRCMTRLDIPRDKSTVTGLVSVGGWIAPMMYARLGNLTSRIELWVDDLFVQLLNEKIQRLDVQKELVKLGMKAPSNLGYEGKWDSRSVANGKHVLAVRAVYVTGNMGRTIETGRVTVNVSNPGKSNAAGTTTTTTLPGKPPGGY